MDMNEKHIKELLEAENEGRLQVLPCKVGDCWIENSSGRPVKIDGFKCDSYNGWMILYHYPGWLERACYLEYFRLHFTRDEVEAALKGETNETDPV